jgi:hypothetical protein
MMAEKKGPEGKPERVEIGFGGGQVVAVRLSDANMNELRKELGSTEKHDEGRWYDLETDDGTISLDLRQVVFVRAGAGEHRIGFVGAG